MKYTETPVERGIFFKGKGNGPAPLYGYDEVKGKLPRPELSGHSHWLGCYDYAWKTAFKNARLPEPGSGFVSGFVDAAFNQDLFLWDTVFITMFASLARPFLPGIEALDNFYVKQLPDGEIPREMVRATGEDMKFWVNREGLALHSYFHNHYGFRKLFTMDPPKPEEMYFPDLRRPQEETAWYTLDNLNHPILAWGELESFALTGDRERLALVFPPLLEQYRSYQTLLRHANGLYVSDWASMDNSPRNKYLGCALDTSCEMVMFAAQLLEILDALEKGGGPPELPGVPLPLEALRRQLEADRSSLARTINRLLWDETTGFYYDLKDDGERAPVKTAAAFWALAAGAAPPSRARRLVRWLQDPASFNRLHRVPVCAAGEEGYDPRGGYWKGSVWAPINAMILYGLEKYGYHELAGEIALNHLDAVARVWEDTGTIWENYPADSISSADSDKRDFVGWSGLGPTRFLLRYALGLAPHAPSGILHWNPAPSLLAQGPLGCRSFRFGDALTDLEALPSGGATRIRVRTTRPYTLELNFSGATHTARISGETEFVI
jgi:hypothetical protein